MIYRTWYNNFICYVLIEPSLYLRKPIELIFVGLKNSYIVLYLRKWVDLSRINAKLSRLDKRVTFHARIKRGSGGRVGEKSSFLNLHCKISKNMTPPPPCQFQISLWPFDHLLWKSVLDPRMTFARWKAIYFKQEPLKKNNERKRINFSFINLVKLINVIFSVSRWFI